MNASIKPLPNPLPPRLNVGCGWDKRPGYLNVDLHAFHDPDFVADVTNLPMLPDGSFEEVVAQDILEHLERKRTVPVLQEWARLLAPGGSIALRVPSLLDTLVLLAAPERQVPEKAAEIIHLIYGTQAYEGDYHLAGFTAATLAAQCAEAGLLVCEARLRDEWLFEVRARKTSQLETPVEVAHEIVFRVLRRPANEVEIAQISAALTSGQPQEVVEKEIATSAEAQLRVGRPASFLYHNDHFSTEVEALRCEVAALHTSTSWRLTAPLRRFAKLLRK